jgi:hypothetical protein
VGADAVAILLVLSIQFRRVKYRYPMKFLVRGEPMRTMEMLLAFLVLKVSNSTVGTLLSGNVRPEDSGLV